MAWVAVFLAVWLISGAARGNSAPLPVVFAPNGRDLPQAAIRVAIGKELQREALRETAVGEGSSVNARTDDVLSEPSSRERVEVAIDELGQLWVRYWGPRGLVDRHLAMPERPEELPLLVSLLAGNLVRQQAFEWLRDTARRRADAKADAAAPPLAQPMPRPAAKPASTTARRPAAVRRAPPLPQRRNSWGNYLVGDFVYVPSVSRACSPSSNISCFDDSGAPVSYDVEGSGIAGGIQSAHSRLVMAYSRAFTPDVWGTLRLGVAFSGGKAKNRAAEHEASEPRFWPWLFELRLQYFPISAAVGDALRPYVHATAGSAEAVGELRLKAPLVSQDGDQPPEVPGQRVTAIHALGLLHAGAGVGVSLAIVDGLRFEAELSGFAAFPSRGWFVRPGIGVTYDF
ncbi:MAG TPA: hypothetical protein VHP33_31940 [Polyangiaceae bacterium]|nr:hypothetical protein [Polyangiaceae bacterium]